MDARQLQDFRETLTQRAQALGAEVRDMESLRTEQLANALQDAEDAGDQAEGRRDAEVRNAEEERDERELVLVNAALARITAGSYGQCESCGVEIPLARLQAQPAAALCIECQEKLEQQQARAA